MIIYRYPLKFSCVAEELDLPVGFKILKLDSKEGENCLWILINEHAPIKTVKFHTVGTGWDIPQELLATWDYVGTLIESDKYVWHVFMEKQ